MGSPAGLSFSTIAPNLYRRLAARSIGDWNCTESTASNFAKIAHVGQTKSGRRRVRIREFSTRSTDFRHLPRRRLASDARRRTAPRSRAVSGALWRGPIFLEIAVRVAVLRCAGGTIVAMAPPSPVRVRGRQENDVRTSKRPFSPPKPLTDEFSSIIQHIRQVVVLQARGRR